MTRPEPSHARRRRPCLVDRSRRDQVELRDRRDDPNQFNRRTLDAGEIADLTKKAEADYYAIGDPDLVEIGKRLFRWLDGTDRWLGGQLGTFGAGPVALLIEAGPTLGHLPWEVLHDGTAFLVRGARPAVLPVRWRKRRRWPSPRRTARSTCCSWPPARSGSAPS